MRERKTNSRFTGAMSLTAAILLLGGCSTYVTVNSDPEGASITDISGAINYGIAPVQIEYDTG